MNMFNYTPSSESPLKRRITATRLKALSAEQEPRVEQTAWHIESGAPQGPRAERPTQHVQAMGLPGFPTEEQESLARWTTQPIQATAWQNTLMTGLRELEPPKEWPTQPIPTVTRQESPTGPLIQPTATKKRGHWLLYGLSLLLVGLIISGVVLAPTLYHQVSPSRRAASSPDLRHALHPKTSVVHSTKVDNTVHQFMQSMLQKNWVGMWTMLAPEAQRLWQGETDFTRFEQAKFGPLTLQGYTPGQTMTSNPWLNPDTTLMHGSAVTLSIAFQASAPSGLLTTPSNNALNQGLFKNTLFSLAQNAQGTWQVLVAGPADLEAPVLVPAKLPVANPNHFDIPVFGSLNAPLSHVILPIFMYHHVSSQPTHNLLDFNLTVTPTEFNKQLNWLQQQGYQSITMNELFSAFYYGKVLPPKPVILSFDDGYVDVYTYALPALLAHHYRGVFYIITGLIGDRYMSWEQIRTLARSGMQIASHTVHHIDLAQYPYTSAKTTPQQELVDSKATLEGELGTPIQFFCYPTGEPFHHGSPAARQRILQELFEDGYLGATLDPSAFSSALQVATTPYQLPRIRVSGGENLANFIGILKATLQADAVRARTL